MMNNLLIPTDGSDFSRTAISYGIYMARKFSAKLMGLHVMDVRLLQVSTFQETSETGDHTFSDSLIPAIEQSLHDKADAILKAFQEQCRPSGLEVATQKTLGIVGDVIVEEGKEADCIILAQRGEHSRIGSGILGSTVESVIRRAGRAVMVTPQTFQEIESMALAYDGSPPAENALKLAVELSIQAAWPLSVIIVADNQRLGADLNARVEAFVKPIEEDGNRKIDVDTIILTGKEDREILRFIHDGSVELIVMGAYGHNKLRELILGSTTSYIVRKSPIPVLLIR